MRSEKSIDSHIPKLIWVHNTLGLARHGGFRIFFLGEDLRVPGDEYRMAVVARDPGGTLGVPV
jgi:hypothetical protein